MKADKIEHEVYCIRHRRRMMMHRRRMMMRRSQSRFPFVEYLLCTVDRCGAVIRLTQRLWYPARNEKAAVDLG